jgi:hypothetical protein
MYQYTSKDVNRFWSRVAITADNKKCWEWTGCKDRDKYGVISLKQGKVWRNSFCHRVSWELSKGEIPDGLLVLHTCDNPSCVNPNHLFVGTNKDNIDDRSKKGRQAKGEKNGNRKLTQAEVEYIRNCYAQGGVLQRELAAQFGVHQTQISMVILKKVWKVG